MIASDLVPGSVYFMPTYEGSGTTRLVILSFEYVGKFFQDAPNDEILSFHFNFLPPYTHDDDSGTQLHFFTEANLADLVDINGLLGEIEAVRDRLGA